MQAFLASHAPAASAHLWWTVHVGIVFLAILGSLCMALWLILVILCAHGMRRRPRQSHAAYRVGGAVRS